MCSDRAQDPTWHLPWEQGDANVPCCPTWAMSHIQAALLESMSLFSWGKRAKGVEEALSDVV